MSASFCKSTLIIMAILLFCSFNKSAWSQTTGVSLQDRTSGSTRPSSSIHLRSLGKDKIVTETDCTAAKLDSTMPVSAIGEPVSGVTLNFPEWTGSADSDSAYCTVNGRGNNILRQSFNYLIGPHNCIYQKRSIKSGREYAY